MKNESSPQLGCYKLLSALFLLSGVAFGIQSQTKENIPQDVKIEIQNINPAVNYQLNNVLTGKVIYSLDNGILNGAVVQIDGTKVVTITDINGSFSITVPDSIMQRDNVTFVASYIGCEKNVFTISTKEIPKSKIFYLTNQKNSLDGKSAAKRSKYDDPIYSSKKGR